MKTLEISRRTAIGGPAALLGLSMIEPYFSASVAEAGSSNFSYKNTTGTTFEFPFQIIDEQEFTKLKFLFEKSMHIDSVAINFKLLRGASKQEAKFNNERDQIYFLMWNTYREARHTAYCPELYKILKEIEGLSIGFKNDTKKILELEGSRKKVLALIKLENEKAKSMIESERLGVLITVLDRMTDIEKKFYSEIPEVILQPSQFSWVDFDKKFPSPKADRSKSEKINLRFLAETFELVKRFFIPGLTLKEIRLNISKRISELTKLEVPAIIQHYEKIELTAVGLEIPPDTSISGRVTRERLLNAKTLMESGIIPYLNLNGQIFRQ